MSYTDLHRLDQLMRELHQCAETVEKLLNNDHLAAETIESLTDIVTDSRHELMVLLSLWNKQSYLGDSRLKVVLDLAARYEHLEGALKEKRNDLHQRKIPANHAKQ